MDELPPSARALLDIARDLDDPSAEQRVRSDAAFRASLARRGIHGLPLPANATAPRGWLRTGFGSRGLVAAKLSAGALAVLAVSYVGLRWLQSTPHDGQRQQPTTAQPSALEVAFPPRQETREPSAVSRPIEAVQEAEHRVPAHPPRQTDARRPSRSADGPLARELRTVALVDALVRKQHFNDALRMLEHTESESSAVLHEERRALRILARCGLAPTARALRERDQFLRDSPRSVLADRVRNACDKPVREEP